MILKKSILVLVKIHVSLSSNVLGVVLDDTLSRTPKLRMHFFVMDKTPYVQ